MSKIIRKQPETIIQYNEKYVSDCRTKVKSHYDAVKSFSKLESDDKKTLPQLYVEGFDELGIWKQIESDNKSFFPTLISSMAKIVAHTKLNHSESISASDDKLNDDLNVGHNIDSLNDLIRQSRKKSSKKKKQLDLYKQAPKATPVDDDFFRLSEMEAFLNQEEKTDNKTDDENEDENEIDLFQTFSDDDEEDDAAENATYADFFDAPDTATKIPNEDSESEQDSEDESLNEDDESDGSESLEDGAEEDLDLRDMDDEVGESSSKHKYDDTSGFALPVVESDDSGEDGEAIEDILGRDADRKGQDQEDEIDESKLSSFEKRQLELREKISTLEEENLGAKSWQYKGEVAAGNRPVNSLLEEIVQFDHTTRAAPVITEEVTKSLEDVIKQRIRDQAWDDVERKIKPVQQPFEYRKRLEIDTEKSKLSLAQVYEKEYLKRRQDEKDEEVSPEELEIKKLMRQVFVQLDALSNFNYTPRPPEPEVKMINNLPSITVEEALPVAENESRLLAPQEILAAPKGDVKSKSERTSTDRKRERRQKKRKQHEIKMRQDKKDKFNAERGRNSISSNKYVKQSQQDAKNKLKLGINTEQGDKSALKSSKAFFDRLQAQVTSQVAAKKRGGSANNKSDSISAKKLKL